MTSRNKGFNNKVNSTTERDKVLSESGSNLISTPATNKSRSFDRKDLFQRVGNDLREFLEILEEKNELITISKKVKKKFELAAIVSKFDKKEALLFTNVDESKFRVASNLNCRLRDN